MGAQLQTLLFQRNGHQIVANGRRVHLTNAICQCDDVFTVMLA